MKLKLLAACFGCRHATPQPGKLLCSRCEDRAARAQRVDMAEARLADQLSWAMGARYAMDTAYAIRSLIEAVAADPR